MHKKIFIGILTGLLVFSTPGFAFAQSGISPSQAPSGVSPNTPPSGVSGSSMFRLQNPLSFDTFCGLIKGIFNALLIIGVPVAMFFIAYSGFLFVTARGNPGKLEIAKTNALYVVVGIAIFLGAWFLAQIIAATIRALPGGPTVLSC